jgi:hypothetical protein
VFFNEDCAHRWHGRPTGPTRDQSASAFFLLSGHTSP